MPKITKFVPGTFCWADLATTNAKAAKTFYTKLFGWTLKDLPAGEGMIYTMLQVNGVDVAALSEMPDQPSHWNSYVSVENVDDMADRAKSLGATIVAGPFDVFDSGRMAIIQDPQGAFLFLWQPYNHQGAGLIGEPGTLCWNELATHDSAKASEFYSKLFGWKPIANEVHNTTYTVFMNGDKMAAGMFPMGKEFKDVPPHWAVFFCVKNCKESLDNAVSLGGQVIVEPTPVENFGCFAVVQDPQGAPFGIVAMGDEKCSPTEECCCC